MRTLRLELIPDLRRRSVGVGVERVVDERAGRARRLERRPHGLVHGVVDVGRVGHAAGGVGPVDLQLATAGRVPCSVNTTGPEVRQLPVVQLLRADADSLVDTAPLVDAGPYGLRGVAEASLVAVGLVARSAGPLVAAGVLGAVVTSHRSSLSSGTSRWRGSCPCRRGTS